MIEYKESMHFFISKSIKLNMEIKIIPYVAHFYFFYIKKIFFLIKIRFSLGIRYETDSKKIKYHRLRFMGK